MTMEEALINHPSGFNLFGVSKRSKRLRYDEDGGSVLEELYFNLNEDDMKLARALMMLATGVTDKKEVVVRESVLTKSTDLKSGCGCHTCNVCGKVFDSYQALGGHKTSHRKSVASREVVKVEKDKSSSGRTHECEICHKQFSSGQALGGHKRQHYEGALGKQTNRTHCESDHIHLDELVKVNATKSSSVVSNASNSDGEVLRNSCREIGLNVSALQEEVQIPDSAKKTCLFLPSETMRSLFDF